MSLNLNSHDVLASYRSSMTTLAQNNAMMWNISVAEWDRLQDRAIEKEDSALFFKVSDLSDASVIYHYLDSIRSAFILYVDGEPGEQLRRLDVVSESTYFMMGQGNARELRERLQLYQDQLNSCIDSKDTAYYVDFNLQEQYANGERMSWEAYHFENAMSVEVVNQLDMIKQQLLVAEISVYKYVAGDRWKRVTVAENITKII